MSAESKKRYAISLEDIEEGLASSMGCLATDQITVEGMKVGYMYRESPLNEFDSGWRFFLATKMKSIWQIQKITTSMH